MQIDGYSEECCTLGGCVDGQRRSMDVSIAASTESACPSLARVIPSAPHKEQSNGTHGTTIGPDPRRASEQHR